MKVAEHFLITDPDDSVARSADVLVPTLIVSFAVFVLTAIQLDRQL